MHSRRVHVLSLVFAAVLAGASTGAARSGPSDGPDGAARSGPSHGAVTAGVKELEDVVVRAVAAVRPAVVHINVAKTVSVARSPFGWDPFGFAPQQSRPYRSHGMGSGVIVSSDGYILTNHHVAGNADEIEVKLYDDRVVPGKLVGTDELTDVAVVKIGGSGHPHAELADSDSVKVGQFAIAIGAPFGLDQTVTLGVVSARGRRGIVGAGGSYEDFIQTDVAINPGNSGGPLTNLEGKVIGINTAIFSRSGGYQGIGFAIPANLAKTIMNRLVKVGYVERAWLGVVLQDVSSDLAPLLGLSKPQGAVVSQVVSGSPADSAGLKIGDVVVTVAGKTVRNSGDLRNRIAHTPVGKTVEIEYVRDGQRRTARPRLASHPAHRPAVPAANAEQDEAPTGGRIGIRARPITTAEARQLGYPDANGLLITKVYRGGAAERAGLETGEVILEVNRAPVNSYDDFGRSLKGRDPGEPLLFLIRNRIGTRFVVLR